MAESLLLTMTLSRRSELRRERSRNTVEKNVSIGRLFSAGTGW